MDRMLLLLIIGAVTGAVMCQPEITPEVAFSAGLTHNVTLQHTAIVVFDRVFTNIGGGYDSTTGNFNCPVTGTYVFQFSALSHMDKSAWLELYHNTDYIVSAYGHTAGDYATTGNSVVLHLTTGDQVCIKTVDNSYGVDTIIYGQPNEVYSTFSGYLIAPLTPVFDIG